DTHRESKATHRYHSRRRDSPYPKKRSKPTAPAITVVNASARDELERSHTDNTSAAVAASRPNGAVNTAGGAFAWRRSRNSAAQVAPYVSNRMMVLIAANFTNDPVNVNATITTDDKRIAMCGVRKRE